MKALTAFVMLVAATSTCLAQGKSVWKLGGSAGYGLGGDLEENNFVPGVHLAWLREAVPQGGKGAPVGLGVELGWARMEDAFSESSDGLKLDGDMEVDEFTLALLLKLPIGEKTTVDLICGAGYYDPKLDLGVDTSGMAAAADIPDLRVDVDVRAEVDPAFGAIIGLGCTYQASDRLELFADYRFNAVEFEAEVRGDANLSAGGRSANISLDEEVEGTFDHGILRAGASLRF